MNIDSYEAERLRKLIDELKNEFKSPKTPDFVKRRIQERVMFLGNEILPVVLTNTTIHHSEVMRYCIRVFDKAIEWECNALLIYIAIKDDYEDTPRVGIANSRQMLDFGTPGAMEIICNSVEILNTDGCGSVDNVECFTLPIHELL